ncbi:MAG TPA: hypothetical protein VM597_29765 [Gemmataceae bacterium]|jgi:WD40 repeat protein|nr:hypothetical protein [Gemmataceae bacterium]
MRTLGILLITLTTTAAAVAQESPLPPGNRTPVLRVSHAGPHAPVTSLAFAPDGTTLYAGGLDKVVRVYTRIGDQFRETGALRLPVGPGNAGAVNAVAVSADGRWVAVAGRGPMRDEAGIGQDAVVIDSRQLPPAMRRDVGVVYLFDRTNPNGGKVLRGHQGEVRALAFSDPSPGGGPVLVSAGLERGDNGKPVGVARAWDVATGKEIAARTGFPAAPTRPGLAAWPVGGGKKGVRVAVAWPEPDPKTPGELRVWDVAENTVQTFPDGAFNLPLAFRPGRQGAAAIVSGGFWNEPGGSPASGRLVVRPADGQGAVQSVAFPKKGDIHFLPLALAPAGESLAVLLESTAKPDRPGDRPTELLLLGPDDATQRRVGLTGVSVASRPALASSRDGRFVAVGGFTDRRVEVYDVAALAAGKGGPQVLPGAAGGFVAVSFLDGNKLWLGEANQTPAKGGLVFDFAARRATANDGQQKASAPADAEITLDADRKPAEVVVRAGGRRTVCTLRASELPTAAAYLPAGPAWNKGRGPVVAVAHTDPADVVTLITLFDGTTGRRLRQLVGPEQVVRALAFSPTRPLLAAVGGDRTVSVWSLADLDKEVGAVEGLQVTDDGKEVRVLSVNTDAPGGLAAGNVIEGFAGAEGKLDPVRSAVEFAWAVRARPVGGRVSVRVKGKPQPVMLPVGRGVEQRGPLFALWLAPAAKDGNPDWIGWSPTGPYDASSPAAEARIGWLTATGDPAAPTAFAGADQYRKTYYRKDILRFLAETGVLAAAIDAHTDAYPPPPPRLLAQVVGAVPAPGGLPMIRDAKVALRVDVSDHSEDFPLDRAVLMWRATASEGEPGAWNQIPLAGQDRTFAIDLSDHKWTRGRHAIEVALHRTPTSPPGVAATVDVVFVPPAPTLTALVNGKPVEGATVTSEADTVQLAAKVESGSGEADVRLDWSDPSGERGSMALTLKGNGVYAPAEVKLKPGRTSVRLTATTKGAGEFARYESHEVELGVVFTPPKAVPPPRVGRLIVTSVAEPGTADGRPVLVSAAAKVSLSTEIEADEPIMAVEWDDGAGKWEPAQLEAIAQRKVTVRRDVTLSPGRPHTLRVRAKAVRSEYATVVAEVAYHPPLPAVRFDPIPAGVAVTDRAFVAFGSLPAGGEEVRVTVVVASAGGRSRTFDAAVDGAAGTWKATVTLEPGENRLGLVARNRWREETRPNLAAIRFSRPPRVIRVGPVDAGDRGVADVVATVSAADGMEPTGLLVNGRAVATDPPRKVSTMPGVVWWELTAPAVPVKDSVTVAARNADGDSDPVKAAVKRKIVPLHPPVIALADGTQDRTTDRPRMSAGFKVSSPTPLTRVEVWHAGRPGAEFEKVKAVDQKTATAVADGFALTGSADVDLRPGVNRVRVVAVNAGGEAVAEVAVSYTPAGARVVIDAVEEPGAEAKPLTRQTTAGGEVFAEAAGGFVEVRGRVRWATDEAAARDPGLSVVLFANQVGHLPARLDPPAGGSAERTFRVPVFLNAADTRVRLELHAAGRDGPLPQQAVGGTEFHVRCRAPITQQRLHVLVVGVDVPPADRFALAQRMVASLGGTVPADRAGRFDRGEFQVGAFTRAVLYPPLVGEVDDGSLAWALDEVGRELKRMSSGGPDRWLNDVVLVYYQGRDWVGPDGRRWLHTSRSLRYSERAAARFAVRVDGLPATPGVRLVLLNVADPEPVQSGVGDKLAAGPPLLRYGWKVDASTNRLFPLLEKAVASQQTLGGVVDQVRSRLATDRDRAGDPIEVLSDELRSRRIGSGEK